MNGASVVSEWFGIDIYFAGQRSKKQGLINEIFECRSIFASEKRTTYSQHLMGALFFVTVPQNFIQEISTLLWIIGVGTADSFVAPANL